MPPVNLEETLLALLIQVLDEGYGQVAQEDRIAEERVFLLCDQCLLFFISYGIFFSDALFQLLFLHRQMTCLFFILSVTFLISLLLVLEDHLEVISSKLTSQFQLLIELKANSLEDLEQPESPEVVLS